MLWGLFKKEQRDSLKAISSVCMFDQTLNSRNFNLLSKKTEHLVLDLSESMCFFKKWFLQHICLPSYTFASQHLLPFYAQKVFHKDSFTQKQIHSSITHQFYAISLCQEKQSLADLSSTSIWGKQKILRKYLQMYSNILIHVQWYTYLWFWFLQTKNGSVPHLKSKICIEFLCFNCESCE